MNETFFISPSLGHYEVQAEFGGTWDFGTFEEAWDFCREQKAHRIKVV